MPKEVEIDENSDEYSKQMSKNYPESQERALLRTFLAQDKVVDQ